MALHREVEAVVRPIPDYRARALTLAANCAVALEWDLPRAALITARGAARSALLALGVAPHRAAVADLVLLQKAALLPSTGRLAGDHDDAETLAPRVLAVVTRLLSSRPDGEDCDAEPPLARSNHLRQPVRLRPPAPDRLA
jgi:hypothetical protein